MLLPATRVSTALKERFDGSRKRQKKFTGTFHTPGGISITSTIMSKKSGSFQCLTKHAFEWETILVSTEVPETAQHILMKVKALL